MVYGYIDEFAGQRFVPVPGGLTNSRDGDGGVVYEIGPPGQAELLVAYEAPMFPLPLWPISIV